MKFLFNLQNHTLKIAQEDHFLVLSEPHFHFLGGIGFTLDGKEPPQHWIIFKTSQKKKDFTKDTSLVKVLYKIPQNGSALYYQQIIPRPLSGIVEIEFSERDLWKNEKSERSPGSFNKESE